MAKFGPVMYSFVRLGVPEAFRGQAWGCTVHPGKVQYGMLRCYLARWCPAWIGLVRFCGVVFGHVWYSKAMVLFGVVRQAGVVQSEVRHAKPLLGVEL